MDKNMKKQEQKLANLRDVKDVLLVSVLEGEGTEKDIYESVCYVVSKEGSILGKLDREWIYRTPKSL